jgi:hypothetical protein
VRFQFLTLATGDKCLGFFTNPRILGIELVKLLNILILRHKSTEPKMEKLMPKRLGNISGVLEPVPEQVNLSVEGHALSHQTRIICVLSDIDYVVSEHNRYFRSKWFQKLFDVLRKHAV